MIPDLRDWMPYRVDVASDQPVIHWCHTAGTRLTEPFFAGDVARLFDLPFNRAFERRTTMAEAAVHLAEHPPLAPTAFVFHLSRCGSTLVARMLGADPANRVLSEPAPFDQVLQAPLRRPVTPADYGTWLRTTLGGLGQPAPGEHRLFVKLDSWSAAAADQLAAAFPAVPWLVLYRDPLEVMVSFARSRPVTVLPGAVPPELYGMDLAEAVSLSEEDYSARVLGFLLERFATMAPRARLVEYPALPGAVWSWLAELGAEPDGATRAQMEAVTAVHAKFPDQSFIDDRRTKQASATSAQRAAVDRWARPAFEHLRSLALQP